MKKCKVCKTEKDFIEFRESKRHKDGYLNECRLCLSIKRREYYINNYDRCRASNKAYYGNNKEKINLTIDKEKKKLNDKKYNEKNIIKLREKKKIEVKNNN